MILTKENAVRYVYAVGVILTGVFLGDRFGGFDSVLLWFAVLVAGAAWVAYYNYVVVPRFEYLATEDEEDESEEFDPDELLR